MTPAQLPLRDIHLPPPVSWWPPAPGWWLLAALALAALAFALWRRRRGRRGRVKVLARTALDHLEADYRAGGDAARLARGLSELLRRVSLSVYPRRTAAGLTGEDWLRFLDQPLGAPRFSAGPGRGLLTAPYAPAARVEAARVEAEALVALCRDWIRALPDRPR